MNTAQAFPSGTTVDIFLLEENIRGDEMPSAGLSLVGFMNQQHAINHLRQACIPTIDTDAALLAEWTAAAVRLGAAVANAGQPQVLPVSDQQYVQQFLTTPWIAQYFQGPWAGATVQMVEIAPLLAYQFTVDLDRSAHHCSHLSNPPTEQELLPCALPLAPSTENFTVYQNPQSMVIKSRSLNLQTTAQGMFNAAFAGIQFGVSLPFLHVVRLNGRCYLHNGFHRAVGMARAGATHAPCILRDVATAAEAGIREDGWTFPLTLMESANPPTLSHFVTGRAHPVQLRAVSRVLHVSWSEYAIPDE